MPGTCRHARRSAAGLVGTLIAVPTGITVFSWIATKLGGPISLKTRMLFVLGGPVPARGVRAALGDRLPMRYLNVAGRCKGRVR